MDRLKQEWKETQIPDEVRLRTRNLAWAKIHHSTVAGRRLGWIAVASMIVALIVALWMIRGGRGTHIEQVSAPAHPDMRLPSVPKAQKTGSVGDIASKPKRVVKHHPEPNFARTSVREPERLVLNFTLPESGARLIWIVDSRFQFDGGAK